MTDAMTTPDDATGATPPARDATVTPAEAAVHLGVSERTILRRLQQGALRGYKVNAGRGTVWRVLLDGVAATPPQRVAMTPEADVVGAIPVQEVIDTLQAQQRAPELMKALDLVDRLQRDNQQLAGQVGFLQARVQEQERTIARLRAPRDEPQEITSLEEAISPPIAQTPATSDARNAPETAPRRPWLRWAWKRLVG